MDFDPDAYLASKAVKPAEGGFDPDAYLASKTAKPAVSETGPHGAAGFVSGQLNKYIAGVIGGPVDLARSAINRGFSGSDISQEIRKKVEGSKYKPPMQIPSSSFGGSEWVENKMREGGLINESSTPTSTGGKIAAGAIQIGAAMLPFSPKIPGAIRAAGSGISDLYATMRGSKNASATMEATQAAKSALEGGAASLDAQAASEQRLAQRAKSTQSKIDTSLDELKKPNANTSLHKQGEILRDSFKSKMEVNAANRRAVTGPMYDAAKEEAAAKELTGARPDMSLAQAELMKFRKLAEGNDDLTAAVDKMLSAVKGKPAAIPHAHVSTPIGAARFKTIKPESAPMAKKLGKSFEQQMLTSRHLHDIANSGEMEGYSALIKDQATKASTAVDSALEQFAPKFKEARDEYRTLSEPLDSLKTSIGKLITKQEGGLGHDAYNVVPAAKIPDRVFGSREGQDLMVDALAGGKNAPAAARIQAQKNVDDMIVNWVQEGSRQKTGASALEGLRAPKSSVPERLVPRIEPRVESRAAMEETSATAGKKAKELAKSAENTRESAKAVRSQLSAANALARSPVKADTEKGFKLYQNAFRASKEIIPPAQYKAALNLIERQGTVQEKQDAIRKLLKNIGIGTVSILGTEEAVRRLSK